MRKLLTMCVVVVGIVSQLLTNTAATGHRYNSTTSVQTAAVQTIGEKRAFIQLTKELSLLRAELESGTQPQRSEGVTKQELARVRRQVDRTYESALVLARLSVKNEVPQAYLADIEDNVDALQEVRTLNVLGHVETQVILYVCEDIQAKEEYADNCPGGPFKLVKVIVHPRKNNVDTAGFQVCWVKELFEATRRTKWEVFDSHSKEYHLPPNTTSEELPPGRYVMWTRSTDGKGTLGEDETKEFSDRCNLINTDLIAKD